MILGAGAKNKIYLTNFHWGGGGDGVITMGAVEACENDGISKLSDNEAILSENYKDCMYFGKLTCTIKMLHAHTVIKDIVFI